MSEEIRKYITKIIKIEETTAGDGTTVNEEVSYFIKDSEARASISNLNDQVYEIDKTLGDFSSQENFKSVKSEIDKLYSSTNALDNDIKGVIRTIGDLEDVTNKPTSGNNTVVNNINKLDGDITQLSEDLFDEISNVDNKVGELDEITIDDGKTKSIVGNINRVDERIDNVNSKVGELSNITIEDGRDKTIVGNINRVDERIGTVNSKVGELSSIKSSGKNKSIVENINRLDTRINDVVDNVSNELSNKISGIIIDSTDIPLEPDDECIVNLNGDIVIPSINITYDELVRRRKSGTLVPGQKYRITDYVTRAYRRTETMGSLDSAEHRFDIIVEALSNRELSENAKAINHDYEDPEDDYFYMNNLSAWELKYCLDNDTTRFDWALAMTGNTMPNSSRVEIYDRMFENDNELLNTYRELNDTAIKLWFDQSIGEDSEYSSAEKIRGAGKTLGPNGKESQLCLYSMGESENSLNKNIAYFYYGVVPTSNSEYEDLPSGMYWRRAEKVDGKFVWSKRKDGNGASMDGAIILVTAGQYTELTEDSYYIKFNIDNLIINYGKGVIYYMKDEWENEAPFDFKNIRIFSNISAKFDGSRSVFNADNLYSTNREEPITPENKVIITSLKGYWYLFSGLIVEEKDGLDWPFLDDVKNPAEGTIVSVNNNSIIDTTMHNNNSNISNNTIITAQNIIKPNNRLESSCSYKIPWNIFLSLYKSTPGSSEVSCTIRNIIEFSGDNNIFIAGPGSGTLGNVLSPYCLGNEFYKGAMYKSLPPGTIHQTYIGD